MSASIFYRKLSKTNKSLYVSTPSSFVESMTRAFGSRPWRLDPSHIPILNGMKAAFSDRDTTNPYHNLIEIISDDNEIEVWPEY